MKPLSSCLVALFEERRRLFLAIGIVCLTCALFLPMLTHGFVNLDDPVLVYQNPHILNGITAELIRWAFTSTTYEGNWIPLTWITHAAIVHLFGMNPAFHHAASLLLHAANALLLFLLLDRLTRFPYRSAAVALLFALHPLHIQSVAWAAELKDLQSTFFVLVTIGAYVRYRSKQSVTDYLLVLICYSAALLSKSMVVTLPLLLLLLDRWPLGVFRITVLRVLLLEKLPLLILSVGTAAMTYRAHQSIGAIVIDVSLHERIARACISYAQYLVRMLWPVDLAVFYPFDKTSPSPLLAVLAALLLIILTWGAFRARTTYPYFISGWLWYLLALLPVIGLVQIGDHATADRYTYIPFIGIFTAAVWAVADSAVRFRVPNGLSASLTAVLLVVVCSMTRHELRYWENTFTLLSRAISVTENNWLALNNLGQAYLNAGRLDDALWCFQESVKAKSDYPVALVNLGALLAQKKRYQEAGEALGEALRIDPTNEKANLLFNTLFLPGAAGKK